MLKKNNNNHLSAIYHKSIIYFIQLWGELLDSRTIDIYQHNILNSFIALKELLQILEDTLTGIYSSQHYLNDCISEVNYLLENDDIIKLINPNLYNSLKNRINAKIDSKESKIALKAQLNSSIRVLNEKYLNKIFLKLKQDLKNNDFSQIAKHTKMLISQCLDNGWSAKALQETTRFLSNSCNNLDAKWDDFASKIINIANIKHDVYLELSIQTLSAEKKDFAVQELSSMGCQLLRKGDLLTKYPEVDLSSIIHNEKLYFFVEAYSPDIYSAALKSIREISDKNNLLSFYGMINSWTAGSTIIFVINPITKYYRTFSAESLFKPYEYIDITSSIFEKTKEIFLAEEKTNIIEKLSGAFAYTNISKASLFQEAKFINLWVALESLVRTDLYKDIITNLKEVIPAACARRYVFSVIRNFIEDCERCDLTLVFSNNFTIKYENKNQAVAEMLSVFKDNTLYDELISKTTINYLLHERCCNIHTLIADYSLLKNKIENHYKKIKWQLQRLYRIRNGIAHTATQKDLSTMHIKHLFTYLSITILEIVAIASRVDCNNLEEIFCKLTEDYKCAIELMENTRTNSVIESTLLATGFADFI